MAKWKVDFTGVEDKSGYDSIVPGKYLVAVESISKEEGDEYPYLQWSLKIMAGTCKGLHIRHITSLKPSALFNLRNTLTSLGLKVPKAAISLDPDKLIGAQMGVEVFLKPYEGKEYANVKKTFLASEFKDIVEPSAPFEDVDDDEVLLV